MLFPFRDDNPAQGTPYVTYGIIGLCVLVFLYQLGLPQQQMQAFVTTYGFQPGAFFGDADKPFSPSLALVTSMFLHGGFMHLIGNMVYLWIFADNIECAMGRGRFVLFYLLTGIAAALAHGALEPGSMVPMVGASGAISGVLGAYLLVYPKANVQVLFGFYFFWKVISVPAYIVLGGWFALQFFGAASTPAGEPGVAFWAHIGGFVAGMLLVKPFLKRGETLFHQRETPPWEQRTFHRPLSEHDSQSLRRDRGEQQTVKGRGPLRRRKGPWS